MLPELGIERAFQRDLDLLPLPPEEAWVPAARHGYRLAVAAAVAGVTAVLIVLILSSITGDRTGVGSPELRVTPPPRPTCVDGGRICIAPVPIMHRHPELGYNLWLPGDWREASASSGPSGDLLDRRVFTPRTADEETIATAANGTPAWDLIVEVWRRGERSALEWARAGGCGGSEPSLAATCHLETQTLRGAPTVVTTVSFLDRRETKTYYIDRGERLLILRYVVDQAIGRPAHVTEETFDQIVRMIGLV
ncbi:MAG TPA: hypothetical protein VGR87_13185 [Candidatus Limnocylindria bacterium]|jgi:hypothetical protein|nr:hypothetical protein [Candidatus Limnocylindria bacterium]